MTHSPALSSAATLLPGARLMPIALLLLTLLLGALPATAQPIRGQIVQQRMQLEDGVLAVLPEGRWRVADIRDHVASAEITYRSLVLMAEDPAAVVPALAIRYTRQRIAWGRSPCEENNAYAFLVDRHGSLSSQLVTRCSRSFALRRYGDWGRSQHNSTWWRHIVEAIGTQPPWAGEAVLLTELMVSRWQGPGIWLGVFVRTAGTGHDPAKLREASQMEREEPIHAALRQWAGAWAEANASGFLDGKRSASVPALGPVLLAHGDAIHERIRQATDSGKARAQPAPTFDDEGIRERIRQMTERDRSSPSGAPVAPPQPLPTTIASTPAKPALASAPAVTPPPIATPTPPPTSTPPPATATNPAVDRLAAEVSRLREELRRQQTQGTAPQAAAAPAAAPAATTAAPDPAAQAAPSTARRLAFVIGIDNYTRVTPLQNARADARAIAERLTRLGYAVTLRTDLGERAMRDELRSFRNRVQGGDEVLFFFAGHGVQLAGANYLLPADIRGDSEDQVRDDALPLQKVLDEIQERKARFTLAVIDACRDNPFRSSGRAIGARGLAPTTAATGQMVMFSAGAGQQALDRLGPDDRDPNGLFTRVLLSRLERRGISIDRLMREVRTEVVTRARAIGHEQVPALYDQSIGEFFFKP